MIEIDILTRKVTIPEEDMLFGVTQDSGVVTKHFRINGIYTDSGRDLRDYQARINYVNGALDPGQVDAENVTYGDDFITFDWQIREGVLVNAGHLHFMICCVITDSDGYIITDWNSEIGTGTVLPGIHPYGSGDPVKNYDLIAQVLESVNKRLNEFESSFNPGGGSGGGGSGEDGGYYLPSVSSSGILSWKPSKAGMPSVASVSIKGAQGDDYNLTDQDKSDIAGIVLGLLPDGTDVLY